jgi:hypothetical protein
MGETPTPISNTPSHNPLNQQISEGLFVPNSRFGLLHFHYRQAFSSIHGLGAKGVTATMFRMVGLFLGNVN